MMKKFLMGVLTILLSGCVIGPPPLSNDMFADMKGVSIPYSFSSQQHFLVNVRINGSPPLPFLIDTGASISAIFDDTAENMNIAYTDEDTRNVRGLIQSAQRPLIVLDTFELASISREGHPVVVLPRDGRAPIAAGVLGMDILSNYTVAFVRSEKTLFLIDAEDFQRERLTGWKYLPLTDVLYDGTDLGLHRTTASIFRRPVPALIDTGTSVSLMNWEAAEHHFALGQLKEQLRQRWRLEGAIGEFHPTSAAQINRFATGEYIWRSAVFLVLDFEPLEKLDIGTSELIIIGSDLLSEQSFVMDFHSNNMWIWPSGNLVQSGSRGSPLGSFSVQSDQVY